MGEGDRLNPATIEPAGRYEPCADLWTITCLFNPSGYRSKLDNYRRFAQPFREAGLPLLTVECAFDDAPFALPVERDVVHVRSRSALWQKERLLNVALAHLPPEAKKVAWIDADVLFAEPAWARTASELLESARVVQLYQRWYRLPKGRVSYDGQGQSGDSFAWRNVVLPQSAAEQRPGMPGFAWAARRELLDRHGLYDACVIGGADFMMAHAFGGLASVTGTQRVLGLLPVGHERKLERWWRRVRETLRPPPQSRFARHFERWSAGVRRDVDGALGCVPGDLLHLWHGSARNRRYIERYGDLRAIGFDPAEDLWKNADGTWEWHPARTDLRACADSYFRGRNEDE